MIESRRVQIFRKIK